MLAGEPSAGRAYPPRSLSVPPGRPMPSWRAEPIGALSPSGRAATIRRSSEFLEVRSRGRRRVGKRLVLYVLAGEGPARAGFICGRGVGGAVHRNRARRVLKEAWRSMSPTIAPGTRVIAVARQEIRGARMQDVADELVELLRPETGV